MSKRLFIVVEGTDCVGKSTLAKKLADSLGYVYLKTPSEVFLERRIFFDTEGNSYFSRFFFYLSGLYKSSADIKHNLKNSGVIVDRYLDSLEFTHEILLKEDLSKFIDYSSFLQPDLIIVLHAKKNSLMSRILHKRKLSDSHLEENIDFIIDFQEKLLSKKYVSDYVMVDTSVNNKEGVVQICLDYLQKMI